MTKKIISVFLVLTVLINAIGLGFCFKSSAVVGIDDAVIVAVTVGVVSILSSVCASVGTAVVDKITSGEAEEARVQKVNKIARESGELVQIGKPNSTYESYLFYPAEGLSAEDTELAQGLCDELNSRVNLDTLISGFQQANGGVGGQFNVSSSIYENARDQITKSVSSYLAKTAFDGSFVNTSGFKMNALEQDLNFVGPVMPTQGETADYVLTVPFLLYKKPGDYTEEDNISNICGFDAHYWNGGYYATANIPCYCCGMYIIYEDEFYYCGMRGQNWGFSTNTPCSTSFYFYNNYYSSSGVCLNDVLRSKGKNDFVGLNVGYYFGKSPNIPDSPADSISTSVVESTSDPFGITVVNSDVAPLIEAQQAGILPAEYPIVFDENGNIVSANGISLTTIQALLDELVNGQFKYQDMEGALNTIKGYLKKIDANSDEVESILRTIRSNIVDVEALNTAIEGVKGLQEETRDYVKSISDALAISEEAEIEKEDFDIDTIVGEHTGLAEASAFVENWGLVTQIKSLLNNVLDGDKYTENPPSFKFYWDSDNNGETETYNALDLSFLETPLTNDNLDDKARFRQSMTVREFIQALMVFLCYIAFGIKLLKKLPGLFNGGESASEDFQTVEKIGRDGHL